jgi:hypothetical protein
MPSSAEYLAKAAALSAMAAKENDPKTKGLLEQLHADYLRLAEHKAAGLTMDIDLPEPYAARGPQETSH